MFFPSDNDTPPTTYYSENLPVNYTSDNDELTLTAKKSSSIDTKKVNEKLLSTIQKSKADIANFSQKINCSSDNLCYIKIDRSITDDPKKITRFTNSPYMHTGQL